MSEVKEPVAPVEETTAPETTEATTDATEAVSDECAKAGCADSSRDWIALLEEARNLEYQRRDALGMALQTKTVDTVDEAIEASNKYLAYIKGE